MTRCPSDNQLAELVDGALAEAARAAIERHLDDCHACTLLAAELAWVVGERAAAPPGYRFVRELAPGVFDAIDRSGRRAIVELGDVDPALATVRDPAVAEVRDVGPGFVAYEPLHLTLRAWGEDRSVAERLAAWRRVLGGLAALHRAGVVHGRPSPDHVFVDGERVLIAGFARPLARTAGYLAAELLEGRPATARSDQLAACVGIYEAVAGKRPFAGATAGALAVAMASPAAPPPGLDRAAASAVVRGLAFAETARWPDVDALRAALDERARDRTPWVIAVVTAMIAICVVVWIAS